MNPLNQRILDQRDVRSHEVFSQYQQEKTEAVNIALISDIKEDVRQPRIILFSYLFTSIIELNQG